MNKKTLTFSKGNVKIIENKNHEKFNFTVIFQTDFHFENFKVEYRSKLPAIARNEMKMKFAQSFGQNLKITDKIHQISIQFFSLIMLLRAWKIFT